MAASTTFGSTRTSPVPRDGVSGTAVAAALPPGAAAGAPSAHPAGALPVEEDQNFSGSAVPVGTGMAAVVRIPIPGTNGLYLELWPRNYKGESSSTVFLQTSKGKPHLRLDYGWNKVTGRIDYHWNQKGTAATFGIEGHTPVGTMGKVLYQGAKWFRYGGRVLLVVGAAADAYSIVVAKNRWRQTTRVAGGWAVAWAGCRVAGALGAEAGTLAEPGLGTAIGGLGGCVVGGIAGYAGASWAAGHAYDWVEETFFEAVPEVEPDEVQ